MKLLSRKKRLLLILFTKFAVQQRMLGYFEKKALHVFAFIPPIPFGLTGNIDETSYMKKRTFRHYGFLLFFFLFFFLRKFKLPRYLVCFFIYEIIPFSIFGQIVN